MILRRVLSTLIVCLFFLFVAGQTGLRNLLGSVPLPWVVFAQDLNKTVLPITGFQLRLKPKSTMNWAALKSKVSLGEEADFGTGFCVDPECRFIGTNYHVAVNVRPRKINGDQVVERYLATSPDDDGAAVNDALSGSPLKYALIRDLAIFELRHPLPHYHGMAFSLNDLQIGQQVDIYAYPKESIHPIRNLVQFRGAFKGETIGGLLAFDYSFANGKAIRPGSSGALVVDCKTQQIVGVLDAVAKNGEAVAMAVPIQSLADFVSKVQPWLSQRIFPSANKETISPASADLYPKFVWPPAMESLQHRTDEPADVKVLRQKAQLLADSMRNFIAVQPFEFGSGSNNAPTSVAAYEVQVLDGIQRFRDPETGEEFQDMPFPPVNTVVGTGGEWSELPQMVGTELRLKVHQFPDTFVNGSQVKVFQYRAEVEDGVPCNFFKIVRDFGFFARSKVVAGPCYGEVWTDQNTNILRISEHIELAGAWKDHGTVVTYGWLRPTGEAPRLVPLTISAGAEYHKKVYWCRGVFMNYRIFSAQKKIILANDSIQKSRPSLPQ